MFPATSVPLLLSETLLCTFLILVYSLVTGDTSVLFAAADRTELRFALRVLWIALFGAAGMIGFALLFRRLSERARRRAPLVAVGVAGLGFLCLALLPGQGAGAGLGAALSMAGYGFLTALVLYRASQEVPFSHFGRFVGLSHGLSAMLQFLIGTVPWGAAFPALALPCLGAPAYLLARGESPEPSLTPDAAWSALFRKSRAVLLAGAALLSLMIGVCDSVTVTHLTEYAPTFPATRLFYAAGLLAFGWLADKRLALLPAAVIVTNTYFLWFRVFHAEAGLFLPLARLVETVYDAPIIVLLTVGFLHTAARSDRPDLWAAMSRIIELPCMGVGLLAGVALFPVVPLSSVFAAYATLLFAGVALLCRAALLYIETLRENAAAALRAMTEPQKTPPELPEVFFEDYCRHYHLTRREKEVLSDLLNGKSVTEIAEETFVTERTVRFHIANLLTKTGAKNQRALTARFYQMQDDWQSAES
ncbi:MAG: helix-turn-helix transcriptional regulator [Schwartzia sp.]|nr:helix-turn-helix transcriptional regulator [Schwartzia sp. (in: firmicutes)]